jgi:CelD/BcsL family acetyltransferase involved in cellulose biosynthesis
MSIELIQSTSDFLSLKEDWNTLLTSSASHVPFLRHEYLASWWKTLGGGEYDQGSLAIMVDRNPDGTLEGIAPLFVNGDRLMFLGSHEISDYLDFIAPPEKLTSFIQEIFSFLQENPVPEWNVIDLYNLPENSTSLSVLEVTAEMAGYKVQQEVIQPSPYLLLPESWGDYLGSLKDRYRREINKKITNAETYFLPVSWYMVDDLENLEGELDAFLYLMANNPQKDLFLTEKMIEQMKLVSREAFQEGWLQLAFLMVGDIKAAGYLNFDFNNQIWVYNSGIDPLFENLSPGLILLGKIIEWAIDQGRKGLDFMRGSEDYKYQFGGVDKKVLRVEIRK